jgi:hypothetical protein
MKKSLWIKRKWMQIINTKDLCFSYIIFSLHDFDDHDNVWENANE